MNKDKKAKDSKRNNVFAAAFDYLKRNTEDIKKQQDLADKMGVTKDTVSRIITAKTDVTEDAITKLQTASGCIFNLQWLRGESDIMLAKDVPGQGKDGLDEKDKKIAELERELADKKEMVTLLRGRIDEQAARIADLTKHRDDLRMMLQQHVTKEALDKYPFSSEVAEKDVNNFRKISAK